jgi:hypothetical protein
MERLQRVWRVVIDIAAAPQMVDTAERRDKASSWLISLDKPAIVRLAAHEAAVCAVCMAPVHQLDSARES